MVGDLWKNYKKLEDKARDSLNWLEKAALKLFWSRIGVYFIFLKDLNRKRNTLQTLCISLIPHLYNFYYEVICQKRSKDPKLLPLIYIFITDYIFILSRYQRPSYITREVAVSWWHLHRRWRLPSLVCKRGSRFRTSYVRMSGGHQQCWILHRAAVQTTVCSWWCKYFFHSRK